MAHDEIYRLIAKTLELKRRDKKCEELLQMTYDVVDDYNDFVRDMDVRLDRIVTELEAILDDGC